MKITAPYRIDTPYRAIAHGWHKGIEYESVFNVFSDFPFDDFKEWCEATFQPDTYAIFTSSTWFLNEQDAVFCRLKWNEVGNITE